MNKFIDLATGRLRDKLSDKKAFYEIDDLRSAGLPEIILQPLERELVNQLHKELEMPLTEWADLNRESVHEAWSHFMEKAADHVRLPDYKVNALLKSLINRLYPLLVWPRTQIPKFIFGKREEMDRDEIAERVQKMPVKQKLGAAVMRYMNKKNVDQLSREKCQDIIEKIDIKLTERYTDQKWYQSIQPLFELAAGPVPTDILASYFFHRGRRGWSNELAQMGGQISKTDFKEWFEQAQQTKEGFYQEASEEASARTSNGEEFKQEAAENVTESNYEKGPTIDAGSESEAESNIHAQFTAPENAEDRPVDSAKSNQESLGTQYQWEEKDQHSSEPKDQDNGEIPDSDEEEPIWRSFLSSSEQEGKEKPEHEHSIQQVNTSTSSSGNSENYQLNELFKEDKGDWDNKAAQQLNEYLKGQREYFIREIFRGSLSAYEQAIRKLSDCDDWQEAYPFIDREIFDRNNIDLYSQPALYFTDVMQSYFES